MSPLQLEILLWYRARAADYRDGDFRAPAVRSAIDDFRDRDGMLEPIPPGDKCASDHRTYRLTERAEVFVAHILSTPLPRCVWRIDPPASDKPFGAPQPMDSNMERAG